MLRHLVGQALHLPMVLICLHAQPIRLCLFSIRCRYRFGKSCLYRAYPVAQMTALLGCRCPR
jgi:hypothetical protein